MRNNAVKEKSFTFAVRVVKLSRWLQDEKREYVLSKQLLRSGTAVGALVREAEQVESRADFVHKLAIALKEANETEYWIELLAAGGIIEEPVRVSFHSGINELVRFLTSIIKSTRPSQ